MSTQSYREAKERKKKKDRKSFLEHYIEAVMREMIRKTIDETLKDLFKGYCQRRRCNAFGRLHRRTFNLQLSS